MTHDKNSSIPLNNCRIFDTAKSLLNFECHSIALNGPETHLLLVGNHELACVNFEAISSQIDNAIGIEKDSRQPSLFDIKTVPLFDSYNINRPIVEWNNYDTKQYAVAIDRLVRFYNIDHTHVNDTVTVIDSQHKRPISTISYAPNDPNWLLTGSLDGQIQAWDTRQYSNKGPASLKFATSTPFPIRRIQWSSAKSGNTNQLAVQCDRCIRIYDIRQTDKESFPSKDLEHSQRLVCMDWIKQNPSIVSLSTDQIIRIFSTTGQLMAESSSKEQFPCTFSKVRTTIYDNLLVCASRDSSTSTFGFLGWHWDGEQCLQPINNHIISTTPSAIVDFCFVTNPRFFNLFNITSSHINDESTNRFLLLTWCRNGTLCLVDMDSTFRQTCMNQQTRTKMTNTSDLSNSLNMSRTATSLSRYSGANRSSWSIPTMSSIQSEATDSETVDDENDSPFQALPTSPSNTVGSSDTSDDNEYPVVLDNSKKAVTEVSIENEFNSISDNGNYGPHIFVEATDLQRRMCTLRCIYSLDNASFYIYLIFSRHYPIISQLFVRFKLLTKNIDGRIQLLQSHIQSMFEDTSYSCFYHGKLCLHKCLMKLKYILDKQLRQEKSLSVRTSLTDNINKRRNQSSSNLDDSTGDFTNSNQNSSSTNIENSSHRMLMPSSSSTRTIDSQLSITSSGTLNRRTCGARFSGSSHLICFGQVTNHEKENLSPVLTSLSDGTLNRPQSLPLRSTSMTVTKTRESSSTDEQSSYRTPGGPINAVQIQYASNNQRATIFSAPVRSSFGTNMYGDHHHHQHHHHHHRHHQRSSLGLRRSLGQNCLPRSTVSIYDISILLPISRKLADDYRIDINDPIDMCETNEEIAQKMGKTELAHCWRLLGALLSMQSNLKTDDSWFQTPIAQGLIKHIVSNYVANGDIQSASMFLITMSQTSYLKTRIHSQLVTEHDYDPILYAYASVLHRWRHFYRRTQILSEIYHNCQSPAPFNQITSTQTTITCSICLQPVLGQHFLCALCGHGGHLMHMHDWFSSEGFKHRYCPERDCTCRCIIKQQELLAINTIQLQQQLQQQPPLTPRAGLTRQPSSSLRPL